LPNGITGVLNPIAIQGVKQVEWDDKMAKEVYRDRLILDQQDCNHL